MKKFVSINSKYYTSRKHKGLNNHNIRKKYLKNGKKFFHKNVVPENERQGKVFDNASKKFNDFDELLEKQKDIQYKKKSYHKKNSNTYYEQVLVLSEDMFLEEMKKGNKDLILKSIEDYMNLIKEEYGFEPLQFDLHLDEGHFDLETGKFKLNAHAHIGFLNFDFENEKTVLRKINKAGFINMQDLAQKAFQDNGLDFIRGIPKEETKIKHKEKENFVKDKIEKFSKDLTLAEKFMKEGFENFYKFSLEDIEAAKIKFKDRKMVKRALDTLYRIKNNGTDLEKHFKNLKNTVSKLSNEEKALLDNITVINQDLSFKNNILINVDKNYNAMIDKKEVYEFKEEKNKGTWVRRNQMNAVVLELESNHKNKIKEISKNINKANIEYKKNLDLLEETNKKQTDLLRMTTRKIKTLSSQKSNLEAKISTLESDLEEINTFVQDKGLIEEFENLKNIDFNEDLEVSSSDLDFN